MKKVLAAILAAALLVSAAAACGSDTADPSGGTPESAGASGAADASAQEPYTVKLLIPGDAKTEDCAAVAEAASAILEEKYNTTLEITRIGFGSYPDQVNLMFSSGEKLDVLYNNRDIFISAINNGQIVCMEDYLEEYGPDLLEQIPESRWAATTLNGKRYAVPANKEVAVSWGFACVKEMADATGVDYSNIKTEDDLLPLLEAVQEMFPDYYPVVSSYGGMSMMVTNDDLGGDFGALEDCTDTDTLDVVNFYATDTYKEIVEHHVRHEILMRGVENWRFLCMQTEEEVAEGPHCPPYELSGCKKLLFANLYAFRVIWVDNPHLSVVRAWDCEALEFLNCHNFTQMKYTIENLYVDGNTGERAGFWQLARLRVPAQRPAQPLPAGQGEWRTLTDSLDCADALCADFAGNVYICDSRLCRIYRWSPAAQRLSLLTTQHFRPLSLACDTEGRLLVVTEYRPVPNAEIGGVPELSADEFGGDDGGGCYYPFFSLDRRIRVYAMEPGAPEASLTLLPVVPIAEAQPESLWYPLNQWRDSGDMTASFQKADTHCYLAPDGKTAVVHQPALARATGLTRLEPGRPTYLVDEYNKCVLQVQVGPDFALSAPEIWAQRGEYGFAMTESGEAYVPDNLLYVYRDRALLRTIRLPDRPACLLEAGENREFLYVTARRALYALRLK